MSLSLRLAALLVALLATASIASAQDAWPARPVRIVVPYTPGGGIDVLARILGQKLGEAWGQPVVIDNRPWWRRQDRPGTGREVAARRL